LLISEEYRLLDTRVCLAYSKEIQMYLCFADIDDIVCTHFNDIPSGKSSSTEKTLCNVTQFVYHNSVVIDEVHKKINIYLLISEEYRLLDTRVCLAYSKEIQMYLCIKVVKTFPYLTLRKLQYFVSDRLLSLNSTENVQNVR
jgi:hypothetical protein